MPELFFPYGKDKLSYQMQEESLAGVITGSMHDYKAVKSQSELVREAMANPIGTERLSDMAKGKDKVVIIASDHTRPVPSKVIIPLMLDEIRKGNPKADITILIATGCHRETTRQELVNKFGEEIVEKEKIYVHDCDDEDNLIDIGVLPSGGQCIINKFATEADLLVAEGFIEPHFFAGFSGGRKSVLPGIAGRDTVLSNHCSEFIAHEKARTGVIEGNPIHKDMVWAARKANLAYIVNVVINSDKDIIYAVSGDLEEAHEKGCEFLKSLCQVKPVLADIVISTNGGYPLDQNIYQAVKGMTAAEASVKEGGIIIMIAKSNDGVGGDAFYHQMADEADMEKTLAEFMKRKRYETAPDQWQTQIFIRVLKKAHVIYISDAPDQIVKNLHMTPAHSIEESLSIAKKLLNNEKAKVTAIPDGVSVIVSEEEL